MAQLNVSFCPRGTSWCHRGILLCLRAFITTAYIWLDTRACARCSATTACQIVIIRYEWSSAAAAAAAAEAGEDVEVTGK